MAKFASFVIGGLAAVVVAAVLVLALSQLFVGWKDNSGFASTFFDGLFEYEDVLASRKWHQAGVQPWDCTYAVVSIAPNSLLSPVRRSRNARGWQFVWGGDWQPTPAPALGDSTRDAIGFCAQRLPDGLGQRLQSALETAGNLFIRDRVGETVMIYAPNHGLAARIRYGD